MYPGRASPDKFERFENWLRENGARFDQLELREYDDCSSSPSSRPTSPKSRRSYAERSSSSNGNSSSSSSRLDEAVEEKKDGSAVDGRHHHHYNSDDEEEDDEEESELRGVHARTTISPHTVIMSIPRRCLITVEMGQATPIGQAILHADLDLDAPKHIFLMIYLLWDRKVNGRHSFFWPYYEILPKTLRNMPIFWSAAELQWLTGSFLLHQIADRRAAIRADYQAILAVAPQLADLCTLQEFSWARMCVCSRNFGLQMDGHRTSALVPHADMLNHYRPRETKWTFDEDRQAFTITALHSAIPAGAQVYDSYGQKCNHRFLLNYGFCVEDNRELDGFCPNEVPLELQVAANDAAFDEKMEFWTRGEQPQPHQHGSGDHSHSHHKPPPPVVKRVRVCISNNENTRLLFSLLRALACTPAELRALASPVQQQQQQQQQQQTSTATAQLRLFGGTNNNNTNSHTSSYFDHHHGSSHFTAADHLANIRSLSTGPSSSSTAILQPLGATYHRSCRDIRHPVSLRNERAAMQLLLRLVEDQLAAYPTTLQQDMADLAEPPETSNNHKYPRFSNRRHAKIQVRGEKQVLVHFQTWAQTALHVLDVMADELQQEWNHYNHAPPPGSAVEVVAVLHSHSDDDDSNGNNGNRSGGRFRTTTSVVVQDHHPYSTSTNGASSSQRRDTTSGTTASSTSQQEPSLGFECLIRRMEEENENASHSSLQHDDIDSDDHQHAPRATHHTILRYCADVLGSLRREEFKSIRRQQRQLQLQQHQHHSRNGHSNGNSRSSSRIMM